VITPCVTSQAVFDSDDHQSETEKLRENSGRERVGGEGRKVLKEFR